MKDPVTTELNNRHLLKGVTIKNETIYIDAKVYKENSVNIQVINEHGLISYALPLKFKGYNLREASSLLSHSSFITSKAYLIPLSIIFGFSMLLIFFLKLMG